MKISFNKFFESNIEKAKSTLHEVVIRFCEVIKHVKNLNEMNAVEVIKKKKIILKTLKFARKFCWKNNGT